MLLSMLLSSSIIFSIVLITVSSGITGEAAANSCTYLYTDKTNDQTWQWDLSELQSDDGYDSPLSVTFDGKTYDTVFNINFCVDTEQQCLPSGYVADSSQGPAVWRWGNTPTCTYSSSNQPYCNQGTTTKNGDCCTSPCISLSDSANPEFVQPLDESSLGKSSGDGIILQYQTISSTQVNKTICESGTPTIAMQYTISCNTAYSLNIKYIENQGCEFNFVMESKYACASELTSTTTTTPTPQSQGMSGGSAFILIIFIVCVLYFGGGSIIVKVTTSVWQIPNVASWVAFWALVQDGMNFIASGGKKKSQSNMYIDGDTSPASIASTSGEYLPAEDRSSQTVHNDNNTYPSSTGMAAEYDDL
jgi:hypothetical protein